MAFTFTSTSHFHTHILLKPTSSKPKPTSRFPSPRRWAPIALPPPLATGRSGWRFNPSPSDDDPPEAGEDSSHGFSKFDQIYLRASRARTREEEDFKKHQDTILKVLSESEDPSPNSDGDDVFSQIDQAIALKREEFVKQGLIQPRVKEEEAVVEELQPEEVVDLEEIDRLRGLRVVNAGDEVDDAEKVGVGEAGNENAASSGSEFDFDLDSYGRTKPRILEPKFRMTLAELLDECRLVPVSVLGDLEVEVTGIKHDSKLVSAGDLFVCCVASGADAHLCLSEADKRGAVAVVASEEINIGETLGCKALVIVEDTTAALPALAAAFYRYPSTNMAVIGITGTYGKTSTAYLVKGMYEAMGLRTGMLTSVAHYVFENNKLEPSSLSTDAVLVQNWMAKMLCNGTEAVVMEASAEELASDRCSEVDFDIAVFTNLAQEHLGFQGTEEEYRDAQAKLFSRMVVPERHRKVVNIDDPNASFFIAQGNQDVPVVTFAMDNKNADVHTLKFQLSLFETQVLVNTPHGILEISSGLLGRFNIYNILAAVAVGIAVGAPLEDIVRGIEEIDAVPGRCELIDEEQAFGVIVDHAQTPDALSRLLDSVTELNPRRIITVIGCIGEGDRGKRPIMAKIATEKSDVTMLTSDNPKSEDPLDILDDMLAGVGWTVQDYLKHGENDYYPPLPNGNRLFLHDLRRVAVRCAVAMGEEGDMIVVAGKGHATVQIEGEKEEYFDDREECREALQYVDELHRSGIDTSEFPWRLPESH